VTATQTERPTYRVHELLAYPNALLTCAEEVAAFCAANAPNLDADDCFPVDEFRLLAAKGLLAVPLRRDLGGAGLGSERGGLLPLLRVLQTIGRGSLPVGRVYEGHVNALLLIQQYGTPAQVAAYAREAREEHRLFAVWNTGGPDDVTITPLSNGRYRLMGAKTFASGAGFVTRPFANGRLPEGGWQMVVVPLEQVATTTDASWWRPRGMKASASYRVDFSGAELDAHWLIGQPGDYTREPAFSGGAIRFAAVQLGGAEALFAAARETLQQSGRADDPYQRQRLGEMAILIESGSQWLRGAAELIESPGAVPEQIVAYVGMARTAIETIGLDVMRLAERSVGVRAMLRPHPIERIGRDLSTYLRQPAPDATLANVGRYVAQSAATTATLWRPEA
jgi:alkylation response protein AidB-like acyl-CoA dehydrogenase